MCGRYVARKLRLADYDAAPHFDEFSEKGIIQRFNIAPSQAVPVIRLDKNHRRVADLIQWGLIPYWTRGKPKTQPINARAETVDSSGMFKAAFERRRCLCAADGFYEWKKIDGQKQPYFIRFPDDASFAFAGIWERWTPEPGAEPVETCAHITTEPNALMLPIHNRMPVILRQKDYAEWLDPEVALDRLKALLKPYPDGELEAYAVSRAVNRPANDSEENVKPISSSP